MGDGESGKDTRGHEAVGAGWACACALGIALAGLSLVLAAGVAWRPVEGLELLRAPAGSGKRCGRGEYYSVWDRARAVCAIVGAETHHRTPAWERDVAAIVGDSGVKVGSCFPQCTFQGCVDASISSAGRVDAVVVSMIATVVAAARNKTQLGALEEVEGAILKFAPRRFASLRRETAANAILQSPHYTDSNVSLLC